LEKNTTKNRGENLSKRPVSCWSGCRRLWWCCPRTQMPLPRNPGTREKAIGTIPVTETVAREPFHPGKSVGVPEIRSENSGRGYRPCKDIRAYDLGRDGVLFNPATQQFILLNPTSRLIWGGLVSEIPVQEMIQLISDTVGNAAVDISSDIHRILKEWKDLGLFKSGTIPQNSDQSLRHYQTPAVTLLEGEQYKPVKSAVARICFRLGRTVFDMTVPNSRIAGEIDTHLAHLKSDRSKIVDVRLDLVRTPQRYVLFENRQPADACKTMSEILPMVHARILLAAYLRSACLIGLHAAAVTGASGTLLMPAPSGSGKSTLALFLMLEGFRFDADDLVLLPRGQSRVIPVTTSIGLKPGAWPVLNPFFPEISHLRTWVRKDFKQIRYLPVAGKCIRSNGNAAPLKASAVIHPEYRPDGKLEFESISPAKSLIKLASAGFDLNRTIRSRDAGQLVDWIRNVPSYSLTFSDPKAAAVSVAEKFPP
jgi:hypothetical protein